MDFAILTSSHMDDLTRVRNALDGISKIKREVVINAHSL